MAVFTFSTDVANLAYPYVFIRPKGLTTIWNGTAFVTYSAGSWNSYRVAATESLPGVYDVVVPSAFVTGEYDLFLYEGVGATALISDVRIDSGTEYYTTDAEAPEMPNYGGVWSVQSPQTTQDTLEALYLVEGAERILALDFSLNPEIYKGEMVAAVVFDSVANLTITDSGVSGAKAYATFACDTAGTYTVSGTATFSGGAVVPFEKTLIVSAA